MIFKHHCVKYLSLLYEEAAYLFGHFGFWWIFDDEFQEFTKKLLGKQATLIAFILPLKQYIMRIY